MNLESGNYNILTIYFEGTEQIENLERRITYNKAGHQTGDQFQRASTISPNLFSFLNDPRRCIMKFLPLEERKKLTLLTFRVDFLANRKILLILQVLDVRSATDQQSSILLISKSRDS